jgi:hypothetical protein
MLYRKYKTEAELHDSAQFAAVMWKPEISSTGKKKPRGTKRERDIYEKLYFSALFSLNRNRRVDENSPIEPGQVVCDTMEMVFSEFLPEYNAYTGIYCPLKREIERWELTKERI